MLAVAYAEAGEHLVVLMPGLVQTEHAWRYRRSRDIPIEPDYGLRLATELGVSPLYVRHNSGHPLATKGEALAGLLDEVVREWPVSAHHLDLLNHPEVHRALLGWLGPDGSGPRPAAPVEPR